MNKKFVLKNLFSLSIAEFATKGITFISTAYLARVILPEGLGVVGYANSVYTYFLLIVSLGFNVVGTREIANDPKGLAKYVNSIISIKVLISLVAYIALMITGFIVAETEEIRMCIFVIGFNLFANAILIDYAFQGLEKMEYLGLRQVITSLLNLVGIFIFVKTRNDVVLSFVIIVVSTMINSLWLLIVYIKKFSKIKFEFKFKLWKNLLSSSIPVTFFIFFGNVMNTMRIILLTNLNSTVESGIYNAAFKVLMLSSLPSGVIQNTFLPLLSRADTIEEKLKVMNKFTMLQFFCGAFITIAIFTFSELTINVAFGDKYTDAVIILRLLMISSMVIYLNTTFCVPLLAWKKEKYIMFVMIGVTVFNIIFNYLFIPEYGSFASGIASIASESIIFITGGIIIYKMIKRLYLLQYLKFFSIGILSCGIGFLLSKTGVLDIFALMISFILYLIFNLLFKTLPIQDIKAIFSKKE